MNDTMMIDDSDMLFFSQGEAFIPPRHNKKSVSTGNGEHERSEEKMTEVGPYTVGEMLGRGAFGEVRVGINQLNGDKVALKFLKKSEIMSLGAAERTANEIQSLNTLKHLNIIQLHMVRTI